MSDVKPYSPDPQPYLLLVGDNVERLKEFADNSIDSIVTDSPYGLGKEPNPMKVLRDWLDHGYHEVKAKSGFMNKKWDAFVPQPALWKECYRVLKPGGYLLSFFGTRTYDWGVMALRLAGFTVRDQILWVYSQGFPKNLDIGKAIDKAAGAERAIVSTREQTVPEIRGNSSNGRGISGTENKDKPRLALTVTEPATDAAKQWDGWGTALKPACEPIVVCQKPVSERNNAANVLKWGVGGLNIDACRIEFLSKDDEESATFRTQADIRGGKFGAGQARGVNAEEVEANPKGRWPANVVHDGSDEVMNEFANYSNTGAHSPVIGTETSAKTGGIYGEFNGRPPGPFYDGAGTAARFFYCAKASPTDRDEGLEDFEEQPAAAMSGNLDESRKRNGETIQVPMRKNTHPTVKPTELMRWLVKLVTPPGGICLDPHMGSGTTGKACMYEGFRFIGIDSNPKDIPLSRARIEFAKKEAERLARIPKQGKLFE